MKTVNDILNDREKILFSIEPEATVQAAIQIMTSEQVSALAVIDNHAMVGIISERDYVRKIAAQKIPAWSVKIHEVMTRDVISVTADRPLEECMRVMTQNRIRHLPVYDGEELVTIISITDLVTYMQAE